MQNTFIPLRTFIATCGLLLLFQACHKDDHEIPCHRPKPSCQAQAHVISHVEGQELPMPHQFIKTFGPDGRVNHMNAWASAWWPGGHFNGFVKYERRRVYMLDSLTMDTVMVANLDDCGRPVNSWAIDTAYVGTSYASYVYDNRGRLSQLTHSWGGGTTTTYKYDHYGNIIRIDRMGDPSRYQEFTYDYSKPIKGGYYENGVIPMWSPRLMEFLGLLDIQPHHQLVKYTNTDEYPNGTWTYTNQTVNVQGYLTSYQADFSDINFPAKYTGTLTWNCGGHKY